MAITRTEIAKQLLADGGRIGLASGSRRSKYDSTGGGLASSSISKDISPGPNVGGDGPKEPPVIINKIPPEDFTNRGFLSDVRKKKQQKYFDILNRYKPEDFNIKNRMDGTSNLTEEEENFINQYGVGQVFRDLAKQNYENFMDIYPKGVAPKVKDLEMDVDRPRQYDFAADGGRIGFKGGADASQFDKPRSEQKTPNVSAGGASFNELDDAPSGDDIKRNREEFETAVAKTNLERLKEEGLPESNMPGLLGLGLNATKKLRDFTLRKNIEYFEDLSTSKYPKTAQGYKDYMADRQAGIIDAAGNLIMGGDDDDNNIFLPVDTTFDMASNDMDQKENKYLKRRYAAEGGIMDLETGRQMYGLGKLVKKVTRGIKKIAKSPIGKAALLYAGTGALGNLARGSGLGGMFRGFMSPSQFLARDKLTNIFSGEGLKNIAFGRAPISGSGRDFYMGMGGKDIGTSGLLGFGGKLNPFKAISTVSAIAGALTPEQENQAQLIADETGIDINEIRNNPNKYLGRAFKAGGGLMRLGYQEGSKEPVAKKTMPLLDMGGKEMDLREDGGFVPIGRMEKADDVPARLSKNEFVFTAEAVRNAGDGDIDKGSEVMYNMMKNLESGGDVSEESQGLEGARRMFQTSQRLEEVL